MKLPPENPNLMHTDIDSLVAKFDQLIVHTNAYIIAITETWMNPNFVAAIAQN